MYILQRVCVFVCETESQHTPPELFRHAQPQNKVHSRRIYIYIYIYIYALCCSVLQCVAACDKEIYI